MTLSSLLTLRHAKRCTVVLLSFAFFHCAQRGRDGQSPDQNLEKFSSFEFLNICTQELDVKMVLKWFEILLGKYRNMPINQ